MLGILLGILQEFLCFVLFLVFLEFEVLHFSFSVDVLVDDEVLVGKQELLKSLKS